MKEKKELEELELESNQSKEEMKSKAHSEKENKDEMENLKAQANEFRDRFLRKAAEFENYKKRTDIEISSLLKYSNESLILKMLPVLDDFERAINSWDDDDKSSQAKPDQAQTGKKAVELIYDKFKKILEKQGLKEIDSLGKKFDVDLNDALMQSLNDELEPDTVIDVVEKGYYLKDKVLRHAKVIVSVRSENKESNGQ